MVSFSSLLIFLVTSLFSHNNNNNDQKNVIISPSSLNSQSCGISLQWPTGNDRIVGGRIALNGEFPWQVSIRRYSSVKQDFVHICGGSIISDQWILTAAHCVYGVPEGNFRIVANITQLSEADDSYLVHNVERIVTHHNFDEETNNNDISLIKLKSPLDLGRSHGNVGIVCLPGASKKLRPFNDNGSVSFVTISGWGTIDEEGDNSVNLLAAEVALVATEACNSTYKGTIGEGFICAGLIEGGKDSCQGDSGGPMIYRDPNNRAHQIGIVSWGEGCGRKGIPGVYVDVNYYSDWIYSKISEYDNYQPVQTSM